MTLAEARPEVDERLLVRSLKVLRTLIEEEHLLELDRAACAPPLAYETSGPTDSETSRSHLFRLANQSQQALSGAALKVGDAVDVLPPSGGDCVAYGTIATFTSGGIVVDFNRPIGAGAFPLRGTLRLRVDDNQRLVRLRAIERVVRDRHLLPWVGPVLTGANAAPPGDAAGDPPAELRLTDAQRRALVGAAASRDLFLIQGPPGTGKTTVITALLRYFTGQRGARVLLSSKGHRAIDNALDRLDAGELHVLRLGQANKVTGAGQEVLLTDVLAKAEQQAPAKHLAVRTGLENALRSLPVLEHLLDEVDRLNGSITQAEASIARRVAEDESVLATELEELKRVQQQPTHPGSALGRARHTLQHLQQTVNPLASRVGAYFTRVGAGPEGDERYQVAEARVAEPPLQQLEKPDLVELRGRLEALRAERTQLTSHSESVLFGASIDIAGVRVPPLSVATSDATRVSLQAVRRACKQAEAALPALRAWSALIEAPGALADVLVDTVDVVAATAIGVSSGRDGARIADLEFDVAIVDEAGQAQLTDLIVPLSRARTMVLVGDHQQLPPYVDDDMLRRCAEKGIDTTWLEHSLFELLWDRLPETHRTRLDLQFRMPEAIADFLGREFYAGDLATAASDRSQGTVCDLFQAPVVFVDTSLAEDRAETPISPGFANRCEAGLLAEIVGRLPADYRGGEGLGLIAPYAAQVTTVRQALADALGLSARDAWLVDNVATVDSFQGQERDVILVSLTRSNPEGSVGFLTDLKRLNVTLSRARQQLVIVGDVSTLCAAGGGQERRAFARFARELVEHVRQHGELLDVRELRVRLTNG